MASESIFYEQVGRATKLAQYLEFELSNILLIHEAIEKQLYTAPAKNSDAYLAIRASVDKNTLGASIRKIKQKLTIVMDIETVIDTALEARNRFTHNFFRDYGLAVHTEEGRDKMSKELTQLCKSMQKAYDIVSPITSKLAAEHSTLLQKHS